MIDINKAIEALDWKREPRGLYEPIEYTLSLGGKRLRPLLALMAAEIFGGKEEEVLPVALALEVFHNFTLLHDDVMDKAQVRRGKPCVHIHWNENTAILSGDQMLIEAYKLLSQVSPDRLPTVLAMFNKMAAEVCEGQQYDVDFETKDDVTIDDYIMMITLKTAVLLATALRLGAYMSGASDAEQDALYQYGIEIGIAFQIKDDLLDCYSDPETFGKRIGGDILDNKKTYLWLTATALSPSFASMPFRSMDGQKKIDAVLAEYERLGVKQIAVSEMEKHTRAALNQLADLPPVNAVRSLQFLAENLLNREI